MNHDQQKSILTIALFAAFADGKKDDREREQIRQLAESLGNETGAQDIAKLYQDVLLKRVSVKSATALLDDHNHRQLAYEMAVCVCDTDGIQTASERIFLDKLRVALGLDAEQTEQVEHEAGELAQLIDDPTLPASAVTDSSLDKPSVVKTPNEQVVAAVANVSDAELDKTILNYSILNGALELLPQSWASMAIIPLQIKMVYRIGKAHGVELDTGHIKEFIAAAGVGLTSQYLEQFGRKLLGGLLGKMAGKTIGKVGSTATGVAFSFATTYALGQLAKRYYAGGRVMNSGILRDTFQNLLGPAKQLQTQYLPQIQQKASTLDVTQVMSMVRGA
ncbi:MAG: GTPase [Methylotenera sp. 24-45-7]|jgi:uncharacterized protein (DUF697 family)/tellurite resistance protein|uniref:YcjF family protein n=1 Tax=Polynucleobacter sp. 35-46-11 TaxID=1970425 RepID=UPI000BD9383A|nr:DUF533 domain-containing protein [Polynucleobacter sp. 35-46-11]OYY07998.1 MAG: GTPase [Polynucleobacter sp. 35-46-11]OYZ39614.1 MAG: GTPase [Methylotenera sp. 24-45-7]HQS38522.1 DUF533 domain-containing protein [Methylotenera sp.]HQS44602.1 DUF533 domain-containing protein [Methylotenera sp.]